MLPILNKFLSTPDTIQYKTTYGHIKFYNDANNLNCNFVNTAQDPCIIFFYAGNQKEEYVHDSLTDEIVSLCLNNSKNILVLDTIIEDFVNPPFLDCLEKIIAQGVNPNRIKIITSFNPADKFISTFFDDRDKLKSFNIDIFSYDGFSSSFLIHQKINKRVQPEIGERDVNKHFGLMQKNARFLRKMVHAYFIHKNYDKKSIYTWHNEGADSNWDSQDSISLKYLNIPVDFNKYSTPIYYDDEWKTDEWAIHEDILTTALPIVVETTATRDDPLSFFSDIVQHEHNYFLSEKTYKNFWYGLPFLHLGIPYMNTRLQELGYKTFETIFDLETNTVYKNADKLKNDFLLIDKIANMSLDEVMFKLNSQEVLGYLGHNRKMLERLLPLKNILFNLDKY